MAVNLTDLYDEVMPFVPSCPLALAVWALRKASIDFAEKSLACYEDLAAINAVAGTASYALTAPANTRILKVVGVRYDGDDLDPIESRDVARRYGSLWASRQDLPESFFSDLAASITLIPKPAVSLTGGIVALHAAVKP